VRWRFFWLEPSRGPGGIVAILHKRESSRWLYYPLQISLTTPQQEYFSHGMTNTLIAELSRIRPLRVISRTSTIRHKGTDKTLPQIARELNVDAIIEGSVLRSGDRVRIGVELIDAKSDKHLWAETYDRELGDILKLHSEVALAVANQIQIQLAPDQQAKLHTAPEIDQSSYDDYLKARFYLTSTAYTYQGIETAKRFFESSIQKDSGFLWLMWAWPIVI
jgi:TolB-like protein